MKPAVAPASPPKIEGVLTDAMPISSLVPWFGGKRTMAAKIVAECCPNGRAPKAFWELCAGSCAVSLAMPPCSHHHVVDMHGDLMNLARIIRDPAHGAQLYRRLRRVLAHTSLFEEAKAAIEADDRRQFAALDLFASPPSEPLSPVDRAFLYFIISWQGRNGVAGTKRIKYSPAIRWTSGGGHAAIRFASSVNSIPAWRRRMRTWSILERDIFEVLAEIADEPGTVLYIDPPYVRDGEKRSGCSTYLHEFKPIEHGRLATALRRFTNVRVVVSYYDVPHVRELYDGWTVVDCMQQKNLHVQNRRGVGRCESPEVLILNGPSYTAGRAS